MTEKGKNSRQFDLEERTYQFAKNVRIFVRELPRTLVNEEDVRQLVKASGSVGANYIEASDSLGNKDFVLHIKIARKEAKESRFWRRLLDTGARETLDRTRDALIQEATEYMNINGSIARKSE